jgi:hypothetical protein
LGTLKEYVLMSLLILVAVLVIVDLLAYRFGVDSRDGFDRYRSPSIR